MVETLCLTKNITTMKTMKSYFLILALMLLFVGNLWAQQPTYVGKPHMIVAPTFESMAAYSDGMAIVTMGNRAGAVDRDGNIVAPTEYWQLNSYSEGLAMFVKRDEDKNFTRGALNKAGEVVFTLPNDVGFTLQGFSLGYHPVMRYVSQVPPRAIWGLINTKGEMTIPLTYDWYSVSSYGTRIARNGANYGFIDSEGKVIIPLSYKGAGSFSEEGLAPVQNKDGKWGYIDINNNVVVPFIYDEAYPFDNGLAKVGVSRKADPSCWYGFIDATGKEIIPPVYYDVQHANYTNTKYRDEGLLRVVKIGTIKPSIGYFNRAGEEVIPFVEGNIDDFHTFYNGLAAVKRNGSWGYMNSAGEMVIPAIYEWVTDFKHPDFAEVGTSVKNHGVVRRDGVEVIPMDFADVAISTTDGIFLVQVKKLWGAYNCLGEEILPPAYKSVHYSEGRFCLQEGKLWSIYGW